MAQLNLGNVHLSRAALLRARAFAPEDEEVAELLARVEEALRGG